MTEDTNSPVTTAANGLSGLLAECAEFAQHIRALLSADARTMSASPRVVALALTAHAGQIAGNYAAINFTTGQHKVPDDGAIQALVQYPVSVYSSNFIAGAEAARLAVLSNPNVYLPEQHNAGGLQ